MFASPLVCTGFDEPLAELLVDERVGQMERSEALKYSGLSSIRLFTENSGDVAVAAFPLSPAVTGGELHARFYAYLPAEITIPSWWVVFEWRSDRGHKISYDLLGDSFQLVVSDNVDSNGELPRDRWFCSSFGASIADEGRAWLAVDGVELMSVAGDTLPNNGISKVYLGIVPAKAQPPPVELFIDEFAVSTQPLPCP